MTTASLPVRHIAHVLFRFDTGGLENGVVNLVNRLSQEGYRHSIITQKGVNPEFAKRVTANNVDYHDLNKAEGNDFSMYLRLNSLLKRLRPDILHTRNLATLESQVVGWWRRIPTRIHGEHGWDVSDIGGTNPKYQRLRRLIKPFVHQYVALSGEARDYLLHKIKVPPQRIHHICNGVDMDRFSTPPLPVSPFPEQQLPPQALVFGTVGRLAEVKDQGTLIEAFALLCSRYPQHPLRLMLIGDGPMRGKLEQQAKEAGIAEQIWFAGDRADVPALMSKMQVFVLPSLAEGISNTFLEAMASGLPVIATNVGGNPDLMPPEHKHSHLIGVQDTQGLMQAMSRYIDNPDMITEDSALVRKHCQSHFSLANMVAKYHQLYQSQTAQ
ncbi:TIGR03088 family PEP-CTERM/XrtA system glycosyltransferase [Lacimicrobium alkaliphilum]|uniref:Glycosyl transferase family 1 n=1 Tax=Lacimicrobium alkaliphilum TaxID=1526571 RepID=A0A0U3B7M9_9ALTE|nr:TIGR03088 family PEP-CTERM/XrtA system glycosyltransferase [Lacimicrobium alkaliphilum]ALS97653.1 glycosyl transferase family 1 [Lacimicrobium alkaliphilum]